MLYGDSQYELRPGESRDSIPYEELRGGSRKPPRPRPPRCAEAITFQNPNGFVMYATCNEALPCAIHHVLSVTLPAGQTR